MPAIFVSFRKADERVGRERLYQALVGRFGRDQVFKSGEEIPPGGDFASLLLRHAADCPIMLVLIGPGWLHAHDATGQSLLHRDGDWVRREIAAAQDAGNRIIPVLLGDSVRLPGKKDLPADIAPLAGLQFVRIGQARNDSGIARLLDDLAAVLPALEVRADQRAEAAPGSAEPDGGRPARQDASVAGDGVAVNIGNDAKGVRIVGGDDKRVNINRARNVAVSTFEGPVQAEVIGINLGSAESFDE